MLPSVLTSLLFLLPYVSAGVHKLKLQKIPQASSSHILETAYLAEKYGVEVPLQYVPLMGAGGTGRNIHLNSHDEDLHQDQADLVNGGHEVPLKSKFPFVRVARPSLRPRLHECSVLH